MIARRLALATLVSAGALAAAGCGTMKSSSSSNEYKTPAAAAPAASTTTMNVALSGREQVPPNASTGSGNAKVELQGNVVKWTVTYQGVTGPITGAHFHGPAQPGATAGVVVPFTGPLASPITGSATLTPAQLADLKAGLWYINLHTAAHPGGELRGQVK